MKDHDKSVKIKKMYEVINRMTSSNDIVRSV